MNRVQRKLRKFENLVFIYLDVNMYFKQRDIQFICIEMYVIGSELYHVNGDFEFTALWTP